MGDDLSAKLELRVFADPAALAQALAETVADDLRAAIAIRGVASLALSGGNTPKRFMQALSGQALAWEHVAVTLVDERWVPESHARSNARLLRENHVLDEELPLWVPIPALAEIQVALEQAVADVTQMERDELKRIMRTGTVASTDNRNWELLPDNLPQRRFSQSRAVALDMESATIAANGFRFRVPYGTLLCVSDKPLHGEIKLPGMANHFYRERVQQHLLIGMRAVEILRTGGVDRLHSRKLRSFAEVAFQ